MVKFMLPEVKEKFPSKHVEEILAQEEDEVDGPQHELEGVPELSLEKNRATALIRKLHVNTGHSSKEHASFSLQMPVFACSRASNS